ncbi:MAG: protein tyrosine phosphatase [Hyphomicrobiaceae bacterium]
MAKIAKEQRRALRRKVRALRQGAFEASPGWVRSSLGPVVNYLDMLFVDHGIFRVIYPNRHKIAGNVWRMAQPAPHHIRAAARAGIRTIVNLRGERFCGSYWLEEKACARHGVRLENYQVRSRAAPTREEIRGARELFKRVEYPMLMHCKSGADRVGLMSVLYLIAVEGKPVDEARRQLSARFGHFRQADTGILDYFFESYLAYSREHPIAFFDWVDTVYDADELKRQFKARGWANAVVNTILRRE